MDLKDLIKKIENTSKEISGAAEHLKSRAAESIRFLPLSSKINYYQNISDLYRRGLRNQKKYVSKVRD